MSKAAAAKPQLPRSDVQQQQQADPQPRSWTQWLWTKVEAALWVLAAAGALWYGDGYKNLLTVLAQSPNVARVWLYIGFAFLAANLGIFLYLTVWLGAVCGVKEEWEVSSPWSIPAATGTGLSAGLMLTIALWPVWSFATPVVLLVLFMGMVMSQHFVPSFGKRKTEKVD